MPKKISDFPVGTQVTDEQGRKGWVIDHDQDRNRVQVGWLVPGEYKNVAGGKTIQKTRRTWMRVDRLMHV